MKKAIIPFLLVMTGCAPIGMPSQPSKPLAEYTKEELCHFYYKAPTAGLRSEINERAVISEDDWGAIDAHKIRLGMSATGLICAWGLPTPFGDINLSTGSWGTHAQWVYRKCKRCDASYVYTENGVVTGWSN